MKLSAEQPKPSVKVGRVDIQLPRHAEEAEVVAMTAQRKNFCALGAEVRVDRRPSTTALADLKRGRGHVRSHKAQGVAGYAPNELPQPQVLFAFGLLNTKPLLMRLVS